MEIREKKPEPAKFNWNNIAAIEKRLSAMHGLAKVASMGEESLTENIFDQILKSSDDPERKNAVEVEKQALYEYAEIIADAEGKTGYTVNRIASGDMAHAIYAEFGPDSNGDVVHEELGELNGEYETEEALYNAVEENFGDAIKEAKARGANDTYITSYDPNEWWALLDQDRKNSLQMLFPTERRAHAFLYSIVKPKAFGELMEIKASTEAEEKTPNESDNSDNKEE